MYKQLTWLSQKAPLAVLLLAWSFLWPLLESFYRLLSPDYYDRYRMLSLTILLLGAFFVKAVLINRWVLVFILFGVLSAIRSAQPIYAFTEVVLFFLFYILYLQNRLWDGRMFFLYQKFLAKSALVISLLYAVLFYFLFFYVQANYISSQLLVINMVAAFPLVENVRYISSVQVILLFLPWLIWRSKKNKYDALCMLASSLTLSMLLVSGSRSALLSVFLGALLLLWGNQNKRELLIKIFLISLGGFFIYLATRWMVIDLFNKELSGDFFGRLDARAYSSLDVASSSRKELWILSIKTMLSYPLLGIGPQQFAALGSLVAAHPHNFFLCIAVEWGVPALLLVLYLAFVYFNTLFLNYRSKLLLAIMVAVLFDSLWSGNMVYPLSQMYMLLVAMLIRCPIAKSGVFVSDEMARLVAILSAFGLIVFSVITYQNSLLQSGLVMPRFWLMGFF